MLIVKKISVMSHTQHTQKIKPLAPSIFKVCLMCFGHPHLGSESPNKKKRYCLYSLQISFPPSDWLDCSSRYNNILD